MVKGAFAERRLAALLYQEARSGQAQLYHNIRELGIARVDLVRLPLDLFYLLINRFIADFL